LNRKIAVIGSGFAGLAAACTLAKEGLDVTIFEKNDQIGGRARTLGSNGYLFDMGPSWYWMPDVFERFFAEFGKRPEEYYALTKLSPAFSIYFGKDDRMDIPSSVEDIYQLFDNLEENGAEKLKKFMTEARSKYEIAFSSFIYKPSISVFEFLDRAALKGALSLDLFTSFRKHIRKHFSNERLIRLMEFPILFLGGTPDSIPALYSLMNYAALHLGTWYPQGGFSGVTAGIVSLAVELGVDIRVNEPIRKIEVKDDRVVSLATHQHLHHFDSVISSADYAHTEKLMDQRYRNYSERYWDKRVMSPSCLIFYLGIKKTLGNLNHHNLFFDQDFGVHSDEIYKSPSWPTAPLFYVCCPSKTDATLAPPGHENVFILMPLAPGLEDTEEIRTKYYNIIMQRLQHITGQEIDSYVDFKKSYCINDFISDYNSYKGNAYGLANTLRQTAILKPSVKSKKLRNLFYSGQLSVPGPGVPPALISGQIAAKQLLKSLKVRL
jgi:phytoene desaturase